MTSVISAAFVCKFYNTTRVGFSKRRSHTANRHKLACMLMSHLRLKFMLHRFKLSRALNCEQIFANDVVRYRESILGEGRLIAGETDEQPQE